MRRPRRTAVQPISLDRVWDAASKILFTVTESSGMSYVSSRHAITKFTTAQSHGNSAADERVDPYGPSIEPNTTASDAPQSSETNSKKRGASRLKPLSAKQIPRSHSSPLLHQLTMSDAEVDKKRNRLGYQRISVACSHCRRRKIRCLVSEDPAQPRCQNCAKLDRECHFYPVEQHNPTETRASASSKKSKSLAPSSATSPSSPSVAGGDPFTQPARSFRSAPVAQTTQTAIQSIYAAPTGPGTQGFGREAEYNAFDWPSGITAPWTQSQSQPLTSPIGLHTGNDEFTSLPAAFDQIQQSPPPMESDTYLPPGIPGPWYPPASTRSMSYPNYASQTTYSPPFQMTQPPPPPGVFQYPVPQHASGQAHDRETANLMPIYAQAGVPGTVVSPGLRHNSIPMAQTLPAHAHLSMAAPLAWYPSVRQPVSQSPVDEQRQFASPGFPGLRPPNPG